ncbi:MAG TPA: hypothetical protein VK165_10240 [Azonexus sp.]|nr:hypothetical protein [Azonexus sp.]
MTSQLTRIVAFSAMLAPSMASAIGFGEIVLQSRIGEALLAEIPILHSSDEAPVAACFSMLALRDADLPVMTSAKLRLVRRGQGYALQIVGRKPVSEPVFAIGLRAGCGYDIEREYVLMPEAPMALPQVIAATQAPPLARKAGHRVTWLARDGDTLEDIAAAQGAATDNARQRLLDGLLRANPGVPADQPLAEGTRVRLPVRQPAARREMAAMAAVPLPAGAAPASSHKARRPPSPAAKAGGTDRLLLGAASDEKKPGPAGNSGLATLAETDERLLKLETTLHLLAQEVEKLDQALDLASKAIEAQNQLQLGPSASTPPAAGPAVAATFPGNPPRAPWPDLAISAAVGAVMSVGMAQFLGRRRRYPGDGEIPLSFAGYRQEVAPRPLPVEPLPVVDEAPLPAAAAVEEFPVPRLPEDGIPPTAEPEDIAAGSEDEHSVLALAEIMLSFGRLHGATETLAEHIERAMPDSIAPWSMLLDLYRRGGMRPEFEALAQKIHSRFNIEIADWDDLRTPISALKTLEDYPHIVQKASQLWGTRDGVNYLHNLVHDSRAGSRSGFPLEVVEEIALLLDVQKDAYGLGH